MEPSINVTVPVGVPLLLVTVAVNVTKLPYIEGLLFELTEVVEVAMAAGKLIADMA